MNRDKFIDLSKPDSGCQLAETMPFLAFKQLCEMTSNVCDGCAYNPCEKVKRDERLAKDKKKANFGKHNFETNADIAKRLGISKRQVAKMRKKGVL